MSVVTAKLNCGSRVGDGELVGVDVVEGAAVTVWVGWLVWVGVTGLLTVCSPDEQAERRNTNRMQIPVRCFICPHCI